MIIPFPKFRHTPKPIDAENLEYALDFITELNSHAKDGVKAFRFRKFYGIARGLNEVETLEIDALEKIYGELVRITDEMKRRKEGQIAKIEMGCVA